MTGLTAYPHCALSSFPEVPELEQEEIMQKRKEKIYRSENVVSSLLTRAASIQYAWFPYRV